MKKLAITLTLALTFTATPAHAEDGWALVDTNNQVITVEVCSASVCGDPNSDYSKARLQPGQRYVLQTQADNTGNVAGYAGPNVTYMPQIDSFAITTPPHLNETGQVVVNVEVIRSGHSFNPPTPEPTPAPITTDTVDRSTELTPATTTVARVKAKTKVKPKPKAKVKVKKKVKR